MIIERYGKLKYALVVKNKETNTSKGSAFVRFESSAVNQKVLDQWQKLNPPAPQVNIGKKGKKTDDSNFVPLSSNDTTFLIGGRHMIIHPAVPRNEVCPSHSLDCN